MDVDGSRDGRHRPTVEQEDAPDIRTRAFEDPTRPPTLGERLLYRVVRWAVVWFCVLFWRLEVRGLEHVPDGPFIVSANHRSNVDSMIVAAVTRRRMRYFGKHQMWRYALSARFFDAMGGIPVHRGQPDREAMRALQAVLEAGDPAVVFPEGTRRSGPVVEDVFEGPAFVAGRTGAPILPVGIGGSERAMTKGSGMLRPVKVVMIIGEPVPAPVGEGGKRPPRRVVREATDELTARIQALFDEAQAAVGRPNRPGEPSA